MNATRNANGRLLNSLITPLQNMGNTFNSAANNVLNLGSNTNTASNSMGALAGWLFFLAILGAIAGVIYYFKDQITQLWEQMKEMMKPGKKGTEEPPLAPSPDEQRLDENGTTEIIGNIE